MRNIFKRNVLRILITISKWIYHKLELMKWWKCIISLAAKPSVLNTSWVKNWYLFGFSWQYGSSDENELFAISYKPANQSFSLKIVLLHQCCWYSILKDSLLTIFNLRIWLHYVCLFRIFKFFFQIVAWNSSYLFFITDPTLEFGKII